MKKELEYQPISDWKYRIPFQWIHPQYGRAEFCVCPQFKRGRIYRVFLTTSQQEPLQGWVFEANSDSLSIGSWVGLDEPRVWRHLWCKEHKTQATEFYAPSGAKYLDIQILPTFYLHFGKD